MAVPPDQTTPRVPTGSTPIPPDIEPHPPPLAQDPNDSWRPPADRPPAGGPVIEPPQPPPAVIPTGPLPPPIIPPRREA